MLVDLASRAGLPAAGFSSPLGYWIVKHDGLTPPASTGLRLVVTGPGEEAPEAAASSEESRRAGRRFCRQTVVDLTYFQTLLTDPLAYFDSRRSARVFRLLCNRLGLGAWSDSIDQRAELVGLTYETITEKLYYLRSHAHDVVLEAIIVGFLLLDIMMRIWEAMV